MTKDEYLTYIFSLIRAPKEYSKLISYLFEKEFIFTDKRDEARWNDGFDLRKDYCFIHDISYDEAHKFDHVPCTVLEMMVALAKRCEDTFMYDIQYGDRTSLWFWEMVKSLGLYEYTNRNFYEYEIDYKLKQFMERNYSPDGRGGLFTIPNCKYDLREIEIWTQLCWWLDYKNY